MKAGDTFFIRNRSVDAHLWVVISDPDRDAERVVMVSMTTYAGHKENVCILRPGDHPNISHATCVAYNETRMASLKVLDELSDKGDLAMQAPVTPDVLGRMGYNQKSLTGARKAAGYPW